MFARRVHGNRFGVKLSDSVCDWVFGGQKSWDVIFIANGLQDLVLHVLFQSIEIRCLQSPFLWQVPPPWF
jgi:hypothetical protein